MTFNEQGNNLEDQAIVMALNLFFQVGGEEARDQAWKVVEDDTPEQAARNLLLMAIEANLVTETVEPEFESMLDKVMTEDFRDIDPQDIPEAAYVFALCCIYLHDGDEGIEAVIEQTGTYPLSLGAYKLLDNILPANKISERYRDRAQWFLDQLPPISKAEAEETGT